MARRIFLIQAQEGSDRPNTSTKLGRGGGRIPQKLAAFKNKVQPSSKNAATIVAVNRK
jgi:hypothetical protein